MVQSSPVPYLWHRFVSDITGISPLLLSHILEYNVIFSGICSYTKYLETMFSHNDLMSITKRICKKATTYFGPIQLFNDEELPYI